MNQGWERNNYILTSLKCSMLMLASFALVNGPAKSNGYLSPFNGVANAGVGGAGMAQALDASGNNINPALIADLPQNEVTFSLAGIFQKQKVDTSHTRLSELLRLPPNTGPLTNRDRLYPASLGGVMGLMYHLKDKCSPLVFGTSWTGGGGLTKYNNSHISPELHTSSSFHLAALNMPVTLAGQVSPSHFIGGGVMLGVAGLKTNLAVPEDPFQETRGHNHIKYAVGIGAQFGWLGHLNQWLSTGAAIKSPLYFSKFSKYTDVIRHRVEFPMRLGGGISLHVLPTTDILADIEGYFWRLSKITGKAPPSGLGWRNTLSVMTGIIHRFEIWTFRLGYQYSTLSVPSKNVFFNTSLGPLLRNIITGAINVKLTPKLSLELSGQYGFRTTVRDNGKGLLNGFARGTTIRSSQPSVLVGFNWLY